MGDWVVKLETTSARWELKYRNVRQDSQDAAPNANLPGKQAVSGFNPGGSEIYFGVGCKKYDLDL